MSLGDAHDFMAFDAHGRERRSLLLRFVGGPFDGEEVWVKCHVDLGVCMQLARKLHHPRRMYIYQSNPVDHESVLQMHYLGLRPQ